METANASEGGGWLGQQCRNISTERQSPRVGGSEDERKSGYDSIDPLKEVIATELRGDGANRCNTGDENAIKHEDWR